MIHILWLFPFLVGAAKGGEVCYDRIGCFTDIVPWSGTVERPISQLPWSPEKINTRFLLYTKENPSNFQSSKTVRMDRGEGHKEKPVKRGRVFVMITVRRLSLAVICLVKRPDPTSEELSARNPSTISASNFRTSRKTRFIIHGFIDKGEESWLIDMCKTMLQVEDVNCFCIDWSGGSRTLYTQAANNIRVVGAEVAYFIDVLSSNFGYSPSYVHVIGHSLGAHAAGEVGKRKRGIVRITGLDPAEPYFQGTPAEVRLDPSDAAFVDVIHTDAAPMIPNVGLGMSQVAGHLDFFPNGGEEMPGCQKNALSQIVDIDGIWQGTRDFVACNHLRSYKYYTNSILKRDGFVGFPSSSYSSFKSGTGFPCPSGGCPLMGHYADTFTGVTSSTQTFYLNTGDAPDFSRWRYKVTVQIAGSLNVQGFFHVALYGSNGNTRQYQIYKGYINTGNSYTAYIDVETDVGPLNKVKFVWNNDLINPLLPSLGAQTATVQYGKDGNTYKFCGSGTVREEILQTLNPC